MTVAVEHLADTERTLSSFRDRGYRVILIDPMHYGPEPDGVETVTSLEHTVDALIDLHTEPVVDRILVYVRNVDVYVGTPVHTLLTGLTLFGRRRGILLLVDTGL